MGEKVSKVLLHDFGKLSQADEKMVLSNNPDTDYMMFDSVYCSEYSSIEKYISQRC